LSTAHPDSASGNRAWSYSADVNVIRLFALLVFTCGAFAYGALTILLLHEWWGWRVDPLRAAPVSRELEAVGAILQTVSFAWFVVLTLSTLAELRAGHGYWQLNMLHVVLAFTFPPLIMHITYAELSAENRQPRARVWRALLWVAYIVMYVTVLYCILAFLQVFNQAEGFVTRLLVLSLSAGFIIAALYAMTLVRLAPPRPETEREQQSKRWHLALFVLVVVLFVFIGYVASRATASPSSAYLGLLEVAAQSLPLAFLFVASYFEHRYEFFDLFVKRGLSLFVTIVSLTATFALLLPTLQSFNAGQAAPFIYAIVLLPVVTVLPWLYGRINTTLDRRWLGRRFTTVQAVTRFLDGLRSATTEAQLVERAETGLSEIFGAQVCVQLDRIHGPQSFEVVQEVPIRPGKDSPGRILLGERSSEAPYFSEDVALLSSLADVLAPVIDNLRLQRREQEQDQRARELSLHASRSELKALRAQINPHFLFNALNAIAGLIHKNPAVADRTIEQLADVFRYALRGGESEWALLDEELEFVRAYLEVERARFGSRLTVDVRLDDDARGARVPTMIVQTLVENAVKHGVAMVRGPASVEVHAHCEHGRLVVTVADTGPGFDTPSSATHRTWEADRPATGARRGGYGLANVRQRLEGYFGAAAALTIARDSACGRTIVSVTLPFELLERHTASATVATERQ